MIGYIARRLLLTIPTIFILMVMVFAITRLTPGDAVDILIDQGGFYAVDRDDMRAELGLDKPVHVAFAEWFWAMVRGDLGESLFTGEPVASSIADRFTVTLQLAVMGLLYGVLFGIPFGVISALWQDSIIDYVVRSIAILGLSLPAFFLGTLVVLYGSVWFEWTPPLRLATFTDDPWTWFQQFTIPALVIATFVAAVVMRMLRAMLLETLRADYIRTAYAKGASTSRVVLRHALQNAMLPVVTIIGLQMVVVFSGTVITETIFNLPGLGLLLVNGLNRRDYPVIQGLVLFIAVIVVFINLAVDISYALLDPRIRVG